MAIFKSSEHPSFKERALRAFPAAVAIALGASACGASSDTPSYNKYPGTVSEGSVAAGVNIRTDAGVVDDMSVGLTNRCGTTEEVFQFDEQNVLEAKRSDANGPWIGFSVELNPGLPEDCEDDPDGTVWISEQYVDAKVTVDPGVGPAQETQN